MKNQVLIIPRLPMNDIPIREASGLLDATGKYIPLEITPWKEFGYLPRVTFNLACDSAAFYLRFRVREQAIRARANRANQQVWKDSCVEFFISPNRQSYYNFEFNCIGACHAAAGPDRNHRRPLPDRAIETIAVFASLGTEPFELRVGDISWDLTARIPLSIMPDPPLTSQRGTRFTANFYKCGDELPVPHYLAWNHVDTPTPDFHRIEYFGDVEFG